jgi:hypothetical protein
MKRAVTALCLLLGGCHANVAYYFQWGTAAGAGAQAATASVVSGASVDAAAGAIVATAMVADSMVSYRGPWDGGRGAYFGAPEPDPARRINVQDCTQPVDWMAGNLMCK